MKTHKKINKILCEKHKKYTKYFMKSGQFFYKNCLDYDIIIEVVHYLGDKNEF